MKNILRLALFLDQVGKYKLADKITKIAIDQSDFELPKKPITFSDHVLDRSRSTGKDPLDVIDQMTSDNIAESDYGFSDYRRFFEIYSQIFIFAKDGVWKFSFIDPLSLQGLSKMSDKEGKLLTDQLSVPGLEELYSSEEDLEKITYDVLYSTNLPIEDYTAEEAEEYVRERFPYASIDVMSGDYEVDKNENLYDAERDLS
jgi:hypothetical protein